VELLLSTQDAARLAGVGPTSVKRWADEGLLECRKTAGGHRRFERRALERFLREHGAPAEERTPWVDLFLESGSYGLKSALFDARGRLGAWHRVADEVAPAITELGARWECGDVSVLDEHVASERISRALAHVAEALPVGERGPTCLLACADGDEHTLGLSLAEICLREAGWGTIWAGRRTPVTDIVAAVERGSFDMVALSASSSSAEPRTLARQAKAVAAACKGQGIPLAVGGSGAWPEKLEGAERFSAFAPFHEFGVRSLNTATRRRLTRT
jgi:MerR family transcriptional regulator, light-induced transcriptional regulator